MPLEIFSSMKLICKQLRLADTWFQAGFVALLLCVFNGFFFLAPDHRFHENLFLILVIDAFLLLFVFSNCQLWINSDDNAILLRGTILGVIPWRSTAIKLSKLTHISAERVSSDETWANCLVKIHWSDTGNDGLLNSRTRTIMQRRQKLSATIAESKLVASELGIKFVDNTRPPKA